MEAIQLELFEIPENEKMMGEIRSLEKSVDNVRRGLFARHDELAKKYMELRDEVERLTESLHIMRQEMKVYRTFGAAGVTIGVAGLSLLRSTVSPVSAFMTDSQASSTGLSGPSQRALM